MAHHPVKAGRLCARSKMTRKQVKNLMEIVCNRSDMSRECACFPFSHRVGCTVYLKFCVWLGSWEVRKQKVEQGWIVPHRRFLASARCLSRKARRRLRLCTSVHSLTTSCVKNLPMWWMVWPSGEISLFTISAISVGKVPSNRLFSSMVGKQCCAQYSPQWPGAWKRSTMKSIVANLSAMAVLRRCWSAKSLRWHASSWQTTASCGQRVANVLKKQ